MTKRALIIIGLCSMFSVSSLLAKNILCPTVPLVKDQHTGDWVAPQNWDIIQKVQLNKLISISDPSKTLALICQRERAGKKVCSYLFTPQTCTICILKLKQK